MSRELERRETNRLEQASEGVQRSATRNTANYNHIEKFSISELSDLREDLQQAGLDNWQAGEVLYAFLTEHGYGVNQSRARDAVTRMESLGCSYECMQTEIERVALVM